MRYFQVNVRKEPTEYGFMPTMQMYLLEENENRRPIVLIVPGGGYTRVCIDCDGDKIATQYNAGQWGIEAENIAICGFSAGGHLCASVSTLWNRAGEEVYRPDAVILCYAILTARLAHCRDFLKSHVGGDEEKFYAEQLKKHGAGITTILNYQWNG